MSKRKRLLNLETWFFIVLTAVSALVLFSYVDLNPQVDYDDFFSSKDPNYKADIEISRLFPRNDSQILISVSGDIYSPIYQRNIQLMGDLIMNFPYIHDMKSIMNGPRSVDHAVRSPFWSRLLISDEGKSSNILVMLENVPVHEVLPQLIPKFEDLKNVFEAEGFEIQLSGYPYIVELIRRHLDRDLRIFSGLAFIVFGVVVVMIFHSWRILLGMIIACMNAAALTLMANHFWDVKIGILTANLTTIVFVLTLSHIVFLTFNWKHLYHVDDQVQATKEAIKITIPASFWAMVTTLLGFLSLLFVEAKPIQELGHSGAIGTAIAFLMAYGVYPAFLRLQKPKHEISDVGIKHFFMRTLTLTQRGQWLVVAVILSIVVLTTPYLKRLNLDPSLISFFSPKSPITQGLKYVDEHGGSNPLVVVIKAPNGETLVSEKNIEKLWDLQRSFEAHRDVGIVLALPPLIGEARESSIFSRFISTKKMINFMDKPKHGGVTKGFITQDRKYALFLLRMKEDNRKSNRIIIMNQLRHLISLNGFQPHLMGGIFALQGHLSQSVASSLVFGLGRLILIFTLIALITSLSLQSAFAMTFSICVIPLAILGLIGYFKIPMDMITAPATNLAISMGIDAMIHMVHTFRRLRKKGTTGNLWFLVRKRLWEPIITSMFIVAAGFGIFFFSSFPPTQRFGGSIVVGTIIAALSALFIFPLLARKK